MARQRVALAIATGLYSGYVPLAPGSAGSVFALALAWLLVHRAGVPPWALSLAAVAFVPVAIWSAEVASHLLGDKDPGRVVIDEFVGQWVALAPVADASWPQWATALLLFRVFDITKPFGIRRLEAIAGGRGIVADDLAAGVCAMIGVLLVRWAGA